MVEISTSILNVKNEEIIKKIYNLETAGTNYFHIDVMDGKFVKNNTHDLMLKYCEYIRQISNIPLDIHLMVEDVEKFITRYSILEPSIITFHLEACKNKEEVFKFIEYIKSCGAKVGISIKPNTKIDDIKEFLPYIHFCLIMTVEPGEGGQKLITSTINKIKLLKKYINDKNLDTFIEADGGINLENIKILKEAGVDVIVSGSTIINSENPKNIILEMKKA